LSDLNRGILIGSGSVDSKIWALRKTYGEKAAVFAYTSRITSIAELELCASIARILDKPLDTCLEQPQIAVAIIRDVVESTGEMGLPVSLRELMAGGTGGEEEGGEE
jgi:hypothetical protein